MAWTTPKTWTDGSVLTAAELNEQVRDNLDFLFDKPGAVYDVDEASNYTTSSTSFVDVDATDLALTITTGGGDVLIWLSPAVMTSTANVSVYFDVDIDGTRVAGDDGITKFTFFDAGASPETVMNRATLGFVWLATGLAAGSHTFKLQWKHTNAAITTTLYAGAGTTYSDVHPQFGVKEL